MTRSWFNAEHDNPEHLKDPHFNVSVHECDWRKFVGEDIIAIWDTFTPEQKLAIAKDAYERSEVYEQYPFD